MEKDQMMMLLVEIRGSVQLVAEGHAQLNQKIDRVEANLSQKLDETNRKIEHVASELAAHRADTEAHRGYRVAER
jgi:hypothetical protein